MHRVFISYSQPIRFARFDGKSVKRGLPVLDQARALDPCHRPEGSWALGTRMDKDRYRNTFAHVLCTVLCACKRSVCAANLSTRVWWVADLRS